MKQIWLLVKLQLRLSHRSNISDIKNNVGVTIFNAITALIFVALLCGVMYVLKELYYLEQFERTLLPFLIALYMVGVFMFANSKLVSYFFRAKDTVLLARLPVGRIQICCSKILTAFIQTVFTVLPVGLLLFILYGAFFKGGTSYFLMLIPLMLFSTLFAYTIALLLSIPFTVIKSILADYHLLYLVIFCAITMLAFYIYSVLLFKLADFVLDVKNGNGDSVVEVIFGIANAKYLPFIYFSSMMFVDIGKNFGIIFGATLGLCILSLITALLLHKLIYKSVAISTNYSREYKTKSKKHTPFTSVFLKELKEVFRDSDYLSTLVGMAAIAPFMLYICMDFIYKITLTSLGTSVGYGTAVLVTLLFVSMLSMPSATFISKEGPHFYFIKLFPTGHRPVLYAKGLVCLLMTILSLVLCAIVLLVNHYTTTAETMIIIFVSLLLLLGQLSLGFILNLHRPNLYTETNRNNSNAVTLMLVGTILSIAVGLFAFIMTSRMGVYMVSIIIFAIVFVYALINLIIFFTLNKKMISEVGA